MHAKITNHTGIDLPIVLWNGAAPKMGTGMLESGASLEINDPEVLRVEVGEVPTFLEDLKKFLGELTGVLRDVVESLIDKQGERVRADVEETIQILVTNYGTLPIRAIPGTNVDEFHIGPQEAKAVVAPGPSVGSGKWISLLQQGV